jgi:hypothetical protein
MTDLHLVHVFVNHSAIYICLVAKGPMMKLLILLFSVLILPAQAHAEIYKWKDKNGAMRYSDVPPPSNIKYESLPGKKTIKPTGIAPLAEVEGDVTVSINRDKLATAKEKALTDKAAMIKDGDKSDGKVDAAARRAQEAEQQKKLDEAKQAEQKLQRANCKAAKINLATYTNGGRIVRTSEKGERSYLSDDDISHAKADAQKDVEKYCD